MELSKDIQDKIEEEYNSWKDVQYATLSEEKRKELGAFYTPSELTIKLIENFSDDFFENDYLKADKTILDPTSGAGGLLIGCYFASGRKNIEFLYGIEYNKEILEESCYKRFEKLIDDYPPVDNTKSKNELMKVIREHIHWGDALKKECYDFYSEYTFDGEKVTSKNPEFNNNNLNSNNPKTDILSKYGFILSNK